MHIVEALFFGFFMVADTVNINDSLERQFYDVIVIGTGPVGIRAVQELLKVHPDISIAIFGDEPWHPYNRVKLSSLLSGEVKEESLYSPSDIAENKNVSCFYNNKITEIDRYAKDVIDVNDKRYSYKRLILATGSRANIPLINGIGLKNVFTFRDLTDAQNLMSRSVRTRKTIVIGGGLLGIETARAMQRFNTEVHVIEHSMWLMFNQLDERAGNYLKYHVETLGIKVHLKQRLLQINGSDDGHVTSVTLSDGEVIECDTVIIAAGIKTNSSLASDAGLHVAKGIRVDDHLQTVDKNIFAVGECAEHNDKIYGLVAPGLEQAAVVAHYLAGENTKYSGSISATNLKVMDYSVFSVGNTGVMEPSRNSYIYQDYENEIYRKIVVINGRIRGAVGIGKWPGVNRFQEAVEQQRRIWHWQIKRFINDGKLWNDIESENVIDWPASSIVCNCTGVTRGQLDAAMKRGATTVEKLCHETGASSVCGSCKNLVCDFVGGNAAPEATTGYKTLIIGSIITIIAALFIFFLPSIAYNNSVQVKFDIDQLWRNELFKQISGFSLLALSIVLSIISIRKRSTNIIKLWDFSYWRLAHVLIGVVTLVVLLTHTGFRLGDNLNYYLMLIFSCLLFVGAIAGVVIGYGHSLPRRLAKQIRTYAIWSHILLLWPLPVLLSFHIIKTYYF